VCNLYLAQSREADLRGDEASRRKNRERLIEAPLARGDVLRCFWCGTTSDETDEWEADHLQPIALGGTNEDENFVVACRRCNRAKSGSDPVKFEAEWFTLPSEEIADLMDDILSRNRRDG